MTTKEKAEQLVNSFIPHVRWKMGQEDVMQRAKECALIAVDEMLNNAGFIWGGRDTETGLSARDSYRKYLQEVKQEIKSYE
jgi:lipid-binding SYLF domain-containing protein